jgi:hypothetical protein
LTNCSWPSGLGIRLGDALRRQVQDQLAGLAGTAAQFNPGTGREGLGVEAQVERQAWPLPIRLNWRAIVAGDLFVDHQQRQFDFGAGGHALQGAAQFALIGRQRAEVGRLPGFLLRLCRRGPGVGDWGLGASLPQATSRRKH